MTTHLMLEAALLGVPTLSVLPRSRERCWLVAIGLGITTCVEDRDSLRIALRQVCCSWDGFSGPVAADRQLASGATGRVARLLARLHGNIDAARRNKNNG